MSKTVTFFVLALISAILTFVFYPALAGVMIGFVDWLAGLSGYPMDYDTARTLGRHYLLSIAGYSGFFSIIFCFLYLAFPMAYVWYQLDSADRSLRELPPFRTPIRRTEKKNFLNCLNNNGFIERLARDYAPYLIQEAPENIDPALLKNMRLIKKISPTGGKESTHSIAPVTAMAPASLIFHEDSLVRDHIFLEFFIGLAWVLGGLGGLLGGFCLVTVGFAMGSAPGTVFWTAFQPGLLALLYCLFPAFVLVITSRLCCAVLFRKATNFTRRIDALFYQQPSSQDLSQAYDFIDEGLKRLDQRQADLDKALQNKDGILKDLHSSARDLGTISNATARLLEKFTALAEALDDVLPTVVRKDTSALKKQTSKQRDQLKTAMNKLHQTTKINKKGGKKIAKTKKSSAEL